jgi:hypothetical protein
MAVTTVPNVSMSPEVDSLAEQLGVRAELPAIMAMTRHVFPDGEVSMEVEIDPEIANYVKLAIVVQLPPQEIEASVAAYQRWHRELRETCPAGLATNFCLGMEFDE